jgi:hypothetical protein
MLSSGTDEVMQDAARLPSVDGPNVGTSAPAQVMILTHGPSTHDAAVSL